MLAMDNFVRKSVYLDLYLFLDFWSCISKFFWAYCQMSVKFVVIVGSCYLFGHF